MRIRLFAVFLVISVSGFVAGLVFAFSDQQTVTGTVTSSGDSTDLYICEPAAAGNPSCGNDDSGADEVMFESSEGLLPGDTATWDLRLQNVGDAAWDVTAADVQVNIANDPGEDCSLTLAGDPVFGHAFVVDQRAPVVSSGVAVDRLAINALTNVAYAMKVNGRLGFFEGTTLTEILEVNAANAPGVDSIAVNDVSDRVYTLNGAGELTVIDGTSGAILSQLPPQGGCGLSEALR